jgi:AAA15 family ATPase/GTPase
LLVQFTLQNFRSFRGEQTISTLASRLSDEVPNRTIGTGCKASPHLLRAVCLYGANASGKSTLVDALSVYQEFILSSAQRMQVGDPINVEPYLYDEETRQEPSSLEATFIHNGTTYQYGFAATKDRVHHEWLFEKPCDARTRQVFSREWTDAGYEWSVNSRLKGEKRSWIDATRPNGLFLSTAVQQNSEELKKPFTWFQRYLRVLHNTSAQEGLTAHLIEAHPEDGWKRKVKSFLRSFDIWVNDISVESGPFDEKYLPPAMPEAARREALKSLKDQTLYYTSMLRKTKGGAIVALDLEKESEGTQNLYHFAGPFLAAIENGYTLIVDELDASLHALALRHLINLFFESTARNGSLGQLIFTAHDTSLLSDEFFRRDQIWMVENADHESTIYPLSDFSVRKKEARSKAYLRGRYGGVPKLGVPSERPAVP